MKGTISERVAENVVTFDRDLNKARVGHAGIWKKSIPGRGTREYKGLEVGLSKTYSRKSSG